MCKSGYVAPKKGWVQGRRGRGVGVLWEGKVAVYAMKGRKAMRYCGSLAEISVGVVMPWQKLEVLTPHSQSASSEIDYVAMPS
jgi:hypothetical protein